MSRFVVDQKNRHPLQMEQIGDRCPVSLRERGGEVGRDNGAPGPRPIYHAHYYGAFVYDPDGNNIEAVCHRPVSET